jgi:hypothetical protein
MNSVRLIARALARRISPGFEPFAPLSAGHAGNAVQCGEPNTLKGAFRRTIFKALFVFSLLEKSRG